MSRLHKEARVRRVQVMRRLSSMLHEWSVACARVAVGAPAARSPGQVKVKAKTNWTTLLTHFAQPNLAARLVDSGLIGDDLPRANGLPSGGRILVLAAHQDDETIGAGGTFLLCARAKRQFKVIYYTDGATGLGGARPEEVSRWRRDEAARVWQRLAGVTPTFWDYPNRAPTVAPDAGARLLAAIDEFRPDTIFLPLFFEQPVEHRRLTDVLLQAHAIRPFGHDVEIWGYQITTRIPGNRVVDITSVWRQKRALNRLWTTQNAHMDYAHLAMGRDIANAYYLKGTSHARRAAAQAELFLAFDAPDYVELAEVFTNPRQPTAGPAVTAPPPPDFLVIGMQKSGSYWVTALLDEHPAIRCFPSRPRAGDGSGEAHFFDMLDRLDRDFGAFQNSMRKKLGGCFADLVPSTPPDSAEDRRALLERFRIRFNEYCHQQRIRAGKPLVGEKTTETAHHPGLVKLLYPGIRKVCILRDPRDRVVSFLFHQQRKRQIGDETRLSEDYVRRYIARVQADYLGLLQMEGPLHVLTYERLSADPEREVRRLLEFLGVRAATDTVAMLIHAASFERLAGRPAGSADPASHFRRGLPGDWTGHLEAALAKGMVDALGDLTGQIEARFDLDLSSYRRMSPDEAASAGS